MRTIFRVFVLIGVLCPIVVAQNSGELSGQVISSTDGVGVRRSNVRLISKDDLPKEMSVEADDEGYFKFTNVAAGDYRLTATGGLSAIWMFGSVDVTIVPGANAIKVEVRPSNVRETVTVSADQTQPIEEVSKTVNVIAGQEMRERADFALIESLRSMPGFRVQQLGGFGKTASIKTRGLRNQDTAILIDGVRLRDASAIQGDASPFLSDLTLTSVSKVEVLRGSGSSLYGTNSIGGTVDFQTPRPQTGPHGQFSYAAGGLGLHRFRGNITDGTKDGKFGFNLAAARTVYTKGIDGEDDAQNTNVQSRIEWNPGSRTNISGRLFISNAYIRLNSGPDTFGTLPPSNSTIIDARPGVNFVPDQNDPISNQKSRFFNGQIVLTQVLGPTASVKAYYSGLQTKRNSNNSGFSTSIFDGTIQTANATFNWSPDRVNNVKAGYEFEHEKYGNDGRTPDGSGNFFARAYQSSHTLFVQDVVSLNDGRLQLAGGFRAQFYSLDDPSFSLVNAPYANLSLDSPPASYTFDAAASYYFRSSGTKIRAHVGNGYRVPSLYERFGTFFSTFFGPEFVALGDPNLKPEKSIAFDGGIEQYLAKERVKLTAIYFYTELLDTIGFGNVVSSIGSTPRPFGGYENQPGGISRGVEFSGSIKATTSSDIFASYTFANSDNLGVRVAGTGVVETLGIPKHQFTLSATQRIKRFWVNADVLVASDYLAPIFSNSTFSTYLYRFGGNRRVDLTAGHTFPINKDRFSLRVFGTIENLFDHEYFENGFRTVPRNGRIGVSFGF